MEELDLIYYVSYSLVMVGVIVSFVQLVLKFEVPYGRFTRGGFGCGVPAKLAWFFQESPAFLIPAYVFFYKEGDHLKGAFNANTLLLMLFMIHYFQRAFVFPLLIKTQKPVPFLTFLSAVAFCVLNGYVQSRTLAQYTSFSTPLMKNTRVLVGALIFFIGMGINIHSDHLLRSLRKGKDGGYKIPRGGMFNFVSGANYFGESVEWTGYALACWNVPASCFALFTVVNLGSRAIQYHW
jgi:3-oxo-5-alpha-steroid 4-dehydrogenase 1